MAHLIFSSATIPSIIPNHLPGYLDGKISDAALYDVAFGIISKICPARKAL